MKRNARIVKNMRLRRPPGSPLKFLLPSKPHFVNAYVRVPLAIKNGSGLTIDALDFRVLEGRMGGDVSLSRDASFDIKKPEVMLLCGYKPGTYHLQAFKKGSATLLAQHEFHVTDAWHDTNRSPSLWFNGRIDTYAGGATWGGGSSTDPQNFNVHPASGTRRVAVIFVDTADKDSSNNRIGQRYVSNAMTLQSFRDRWQQHLIDGVVGTDGVSRSVRQFYREVSYYPAPSSLDIDATIFSSVVSLSGGWTDYFELDSNKLWRPKGEYAKQCIVAAGNAIDFTGFDMIVCVSQAFSDATPSPKVAWPYGGGARVVVYTSHGHVDLGAVSMPNEWGDGSTSDQSSGRTIYETLTHELGHTLDLPDEYSPEVAGRNIGDQSTNASWDPMDWEKPWPHFTVAHRLQLGWVQPSWMKLYNFQSLGTTVDETITLSPIELGAPPAGQFAGIEVRIGDGRNYYFEYRTRGSGELGDQNLVPDGCVVGTDVSEPPDVSTITRPDILLLEKHGDDDGAVLSNGQHYHEIDNSSPTFPSDFQVDVSGIDGTKADVRIRYEVFGKPDPSIRPWPRDAGHQWQSPDIEVTNARSLADPASWANVPWLGHTNTVTAHIANRGTLSAPGVVAKFFVKDYTVSGGPETAIGTDTHDIPPASLVDFSVTWNPPANPSKPHYCIVVRIDSYQTPTTPPVAELTDQNNVAQSNYDRFISASASPASRESTKITVTNPYKRPTRIFLRAGQTNPNYRTYLEHTWLQLAARTTRQVGVMFEFAPSAELTGEDRWLRERFLRIPNHVGIAGFIEDPFDKRLHHAHLVNGVDAQIVTGEATRFRAFFVNSDGAFGSIVTMKDVPVPSGAVILILKTTAQGETYEQVPVLSDGSFRRLVRGKWDTVQGYYVPGSGFADCTSNVIRRRQ